ncbi:MAG: tetratricopeptide repeat protein [Woeseiaceae bacterium]
MKVELLDGFRLGNYEIEPALGVVERPDGAQTVRPEVMEMLVLLASRPRILVTRDTLLEEIGGQAKISDADFEQFIQELRTALRDTSARPAYLQDRPDGYRLIAKVRPLYAGEAKINRLNFFQEVKRRDVIRVSIAYWALTWAVLQGVDFVLGLIPEIPAWSLKFLMVLSVIGFPVAIAYAWVYRWTPSGPEIDRPGGPEAPPVARRRVDYVIVGAALIAFALFIVGSPPETSNETTIGQQTSIAVLRFVNIGDDPEVIVYSDGVSDELLNLFAKFRELRVPARESSWSLFGQNLDVPTIAARLNVENVIEGSVRRNGDQIRVLIQLIDASGNHVWSQAFERNRNAILDLPSSIAAEVVDELQVVLSLDSANELKRRPTEDEAAYIYYLQAREYLDRPRQDNNLTNAAELFGRALAADPRFALAHAGMCETHLARFVRERAQVEFESAEAECHRAMTLDSAIPDVHVAIGNLYRHSGQFEKAEDEFRRAIEIRPRSEPAHYGLARSLQGQGRLEEAERVLRFGIELEPAYWGAHLALGNFMHRQGRYEEAIEPYERVTELTPDNPDGFTNLGVAYFDAGDWENAEAAYQRSLLLNPTRVIYTNLGTLFYYQGRYEKSVEMHRYAVDIAPENFRAWGKLAAAARYVPGMEEQSTDAYQEAIALAENAVEINPGDSQALAYLAGYYINIDDEEKAREFISRALQLEYDNPEIHYFRAIVDVALGDIDDGLDALEKAVDKGYSTRLIEFDPQFESIREKERFQVLTAQRG